LHDFNATLSPQSVVLTVPGDPQWAVWHRGPGVRRDVLSIRQGTAGASKRVCGCFREQQSEGGCKEEG